MHLKEYIEKEYIERIYDDILTFLKNVNRLKDANDYFELLEYWNYWYENEFEIFIKRLGGKGLSDYKWFEDTFSGKQLKRLEKSIYDLFYVNEKDFYRYRDKATSIMEMNMNDFWTTLPIAFTVFQIPDVITNKKLSKEQVNILEKYYFELWKANANSRYASTKKIVDDVFNELINGIEKFIDKYIDHYYDYNGIRIHLVYSEEKERDLLNKLSYLKSVIDNCKKRSIAFLLNDLKLGIDLVTEKGNAKILTSRGYEDSVGTYNTETQEIIIQKNAEKEDIFNTIYHELGHKYYFEIMNKYERKQWKDYFDSIKENDNSFIDEMMDIKKEKEEISKKISELNSNIAEEREQTRNSYKKSWVYKSAIKSIEKYAEFLIYQLNFFPMLENFIFREDTDDGIIIKYIENYEKINRDKNRKLYDEKVPGLSEETCLLIIRGFIDYLDTEIENFINDYKNKEIVVLPSEYAKENEEEFFAEVFAAIMIRKVNMLNIRNYQLEDQVVDMFKQISKIKENKITKKNKLFYS